MSFLSNDLSGAVLELNFGMKGLRYWIIPKNCCSSSRLAGIGFDLILSHFSGSGCEPFSSQIRPYNFICFCLILHFSLLKTSPYFRAVSIVFLNLLSCSSIVLLNMQTSSDILMALSQSSRI